MFTVRTGSFEILGFHQRVFVLYFQNKEYVIDPSLQFKCLTNCKGSHIIEFNVNRMYQNIFGAEERSSDFAANNAIRIIYVNITQPCQGIMYPSLKSNESCEYAHSRLVKPNLTGLIVM